MAVLVARAPARLDFGGGWTDVPPYSEERGGCVCNVAVELHAVATVQSRTGGPVDESGSMSGEKVHTAKALALALAWVARRQRRWCGLVAYSGESGERLLGLPPGRWDEAALTDWLSAFIGRGSDLDVPVRELPRMYAELNAPAGKTDVLMVTDAKGRIPPSLQEQFLAWKASVKARVLSLVIGDAPGDLKAARASGCLFYPVNPGHEEDSWDRLHDEALGRFFAGTYAGDYQAARVAEFEKLLPEQPPWK